MFWRRKEKPEVAQPSLPATAGEGGTQAQAQVLDNTELSRELEASLEAVAGVLRARARYAFSVGDETAEGVASMFERWASHVLVRAAPPGGRGVEHAPGTVDRDWRGMLEFVTGRAKKEQAFAQGSVRDMREAIFSLVESFSRSTYAQGQHDALLRQRLASLTVAAETGSLEGLKREARNVARAVTDVLEEQQRSAHEQTSELRERLTALGEELEETRQLSETDPLTKLPNRRVFEVTLARSLTIASVMNRPVTLLMVDVDHFKSVNDTHGHPMGDQVLRALGDALARAFPRRSDLVSRYGGEEFAIVLSDTPLDAARPLVERLLSTIRALKIPFEDANKAPLKLTVSVGVAVSAMHESPADLLRRADQALYSAKRTGRNRAVESGAEPTAAAA